MTDSYTSMKSELMTLLAIKGKPYCGIIDDWMVDDYWGTGKLVVSGDLRGRPGRDPSTITHIRTSRIVEIYDDEQILETSNSHYTLGTIHCR